MRRILFFTIFIFTSMFLFAQHEIYLSIDFNAPQDNPPQENYSAAYLINSSKVPLLFEAITFLGNIPWKGQVNCHKFRNSNNSVPMEVIIDEAVYGENYSIPKFILNPGERVIMWSPAFTIDNRIFYPYSEFTGIVYGHNVKRIIRAPLYYLLNNR